MLTNIITIIDIIKIQTWNFFNAITNVFNTERKAKQLAEKQSNLNNNN